MGAGIAGFVHKTPFFCVFRAPFAFLQSLKGERFRTGFWENAEIWVYPLRAGPIECQGLETKLGIAIIAEIEATETFGKFDIEG